MQTADWCIGSRGNGVGFGGMQIYQDKTRQSIICFVRKQTSLANRTVLFMQQNDRQLTSVKTPNNIYFYTCYVLDVICLLEKDRAQQMLE